MILASIQLSDNDRRALIILVIILVVLMLIIGLIGMAIRKVMQIQAARIDTMMHDVVKTHVVDSPKSFRKLAYKKSWRLLYRQSLWPILIALVGTLIWVLGNAFTGLWQENIFGHCQELFFQWDWVGTPDNPVFVKVFGMSLLSRWPDLAKSPEFIPVHIPSYLAVICYLASWVWYGIACQGFIARLAMIYHRSRTVYSKSLAGYKASEDIDIKPEKPLPPND